MSGIGVVTAVRDRPVRLRASLERWAADPAIDEIVVVDWGSEVPLARSGVLDVAKVVLVAAGAGEPWARGLALNLGIEAASAALLLCVDPGFALRDTAATVARVRGGFVSECGEEAAAVLAGRDALRAAGGWHEYLLGEGFGGQDLYNRLEDAGKTRRFLHAGELVAIPVPPFAEAAIRSPGELRLDLPGGLERDPFFIRERNKLLAGLAPWNATLAALRPRRMGRPEPRRATFQLGPRPPLERRLQDVASYFTARFVAGVSEELSLQLFAGLIDDRSRADAARANRQHQVEAARAVRAPAPAAGRRRR